MSDVHASPCLTTFVLVGIVGGVLAKKADPSASVPGLSHNDPVALIGYAAWFGLF